MKKIILPLSLILLCATGCDQKHKNENPQGDLAENVSQNNKGGERTNSYAIITSIATTDKQKYIDNISQQTDQLDELWSNKVVGNIYMDTESNEIAPTIIFFMKAKSEKEVRETLDKTNFIVNGVGRYEVKPVGDLIYQMNNRTPEVKASKDHTYSVVWEYAKSIDQIPLDVMQKQLDEEKKLFDQGIIENVYLSTTNDGNKRTSAVYFINADSEKEAQKLLNQLPVYKQKLGSYQLINVGGFIRGEKQ